MLMENNAMDTKYHDYTEYIFLNAPLIENIILPYNQKVNKYAFLSKASQIEAFYNQDNYKCPLPIVSTYVMDMSPFNEKQLYSNDIYRFCDIIDEEIETLTKKCQNGSSPQYESLFEILIKICILYENAYLCRKEDTISYKTTSLNIDHILWMFENGTNIQGIRCKGYRPAQKTFDFYFGMNNIIKDIRSNSKFFNENKYSKYLFSIYLEILLLITYTYNEHIKRLYCNEW